VFLVRSALRNLSVSGSARWKSVKASILNRNRPVSVGRSTQREYAIDYDFDLASLQQRPDVLPQALSDRGFFLNCLRTQGRLGNCQPARHDGVKIELIERIPTSGGVFDVEFQPMAGAV
jgi:hypothetical protein